jgi:hypothetical protein
MSIKCVYKERIADVFFFPKKKTQSISNLAFISYFKIQIGDWAIFSACI